MASPAALLLAAALFGACGGGDEVTPPALQEAAPQAAIGQCTRDLPLLRSGFIGACATDLDCPCGSFCDETVNECSFRCMVPPAGAQEACGTGTQCDDTGRCVGPSTQQATRVAMLTAQPPVFTVAPLGAGVLGASVKLALFDITTSDPAYVRAQTTQVRVVAASGTQVSCDAASFGDECALSSWTFAWDGTRHSATRSIWVKSLADNATGDGSVMLRIDEHDEELVVPVMSSATPPLDGVYRGKITGPGFASGVPVTVEASADLLLVRDATRTVAPLGAFVLDALVDTGDIATARKLPYLSPVAPAAGTGGVIAEVTASGTATYTTATGALTAGFTLTLPGAAPQVFALQLQREGDRETRCTQDSECATGQECVTPLGACVEAGAWTLPADPLGNTLTDARSDGWWSAISPMLGTGDATPATGSPAKGAFATTGADLIESLLCSVDETESGAGRLGVSMLTYAGGPSISGDLRCVAGGGVGFSVISPGAVGLGTFRDRQGSSAVPPALLATCLDDLARLPTTTFSQAFGSTIGACANLARFVPALRLLAMSELDKRTTLTGARTRGLLVRLLQQWAQMHGFVASAGLAEREYDDAISATPGEMRQELVKLLDTLDAGTSALLDTRIAPVVSNVASWGPTDASTVGDYREAKKPVVYWTFNGASTPQRDLVRGINLVQISPNTKPGCQIRTDRDAISGDWYCPGFTATLPAGTPSIAGNTDLTVVFSASTSTAEFPPYAGGTILQTETTALVSAPVQDHAEPVLSVVHSTADGGTEWVAFDWTYGFWGTNVAVVRDTAKMTYSVYVYGSWITPDPLFVMTQRYYQPVGGKLAQSTANVVRLGGGQWPNTQAYAGMIDDVAIFNSTLSKREIRRFASERGTVQNRRALWPADMILTTNPTQDLKVSVGATLLESQISHLAVAARYAQDLTHEAHAACDAQDVGARATLDAGVARIGRTVRQSVLVESLVASDGSDRASKARTELRAKRSAIARALDELYSCAEPYGLTAEEVPLYFGDLTGEVAAFFAASDHLLALAEQRTAVASAALDAVRARWDAARQSTLQEQLTATARAIRVTELTARYGEQIKRLCGISDRTSEQILADIRAGTFAVDRCFIVPTTQCLSATTSIMDADPECFRGVIGAQLMDMRASYHAQRAAYSAWQAAVADAEGAERLCIYKEMDLYGCSALNRHELSGVSCPSGHQGTVELTEEFNRYLTDRETEQSWLGAAIGVCTTIATVATTVATSGAFAGVMIAAGGTLSIVQPQLSGSIEQRKRQHAAMLQKRAAEAEIVACWGTAEQYQRAIAAAEESSHEALARMQSATITYKNALAEVQEVMLEAPVAVDRELTRPAVPLSFHYWLPEAMASYRSAMDAARRYTYMALRATEYDLQQKFLASASSGQASRAAVAGAWRPSVLSQQLGILRAATDARRTGNARPSEDHLVIDVARDLFGLGTDVFDIGPHLAAHARPVYSARGEYLGEGVRFSLLPRDAASAPTWRCAERLWRANLGRAGALTGSVRVKLLKHTTAGSRDCATDAVRVSTLRPERNLLVSGGEAGSYSEQPRHTVADIDTVDLNLLGNYEAFRTLDDFINGSSTELAGQGLFGDYVLLFPAPAFSTGFSMEAIQELFVRFDYLSVDNTPALPFTLGARAEGEAPTVMVDPSTAPIIVP